MRRTARALLTTILIGAAAASTAAQTSTASPSVAVPQFGAVTPGVPGPLGAAAARAIREGALSNDPATLARQKAAAAASVAARAPHSRVGTAAITPTPTILLAKNGVNDPNHTPSDSTGAIGTTRYVETVNSKVRIYDTSLNTIATDTLTHWWAQPGANNFDPQVIWDPTTNRFYYAGDSVFSASDNRLSFGFSKTASPNNATTDWCHFQISYGSEFPDYPKLGDSRPYVIIGVNTFSGSFFRGSDLMAVSKPAAGSTCPDPSTFKFKDTLNINVGGNAFFTPTPAQEVDSVATGWAVARPLSLPATKIGVFKVTRNADGTPNIPAAGSAITVPSYSVPAAAPQSGATQVIDTSDTRFPQAVAAIDPLQGSKLAIWTQHAIAGGAGSMERWYEIDPVGKTILQTGDVTSAQLFFFDGAISPDRVVNGATTAFGGNMLLNFVSSSSSTFPTIRMVSKRGADTVSAIKKVRGSPGPDIDFACPNSGNECRWGDYAAATPDPNAPTSGPAGIVWSTSMWNKDGRITGTSGTAWQTWNWKTQV